jgi:hypothetical protein
MNFLPSLSNLSKIFPGDDKHDEDSLERELLSLESEIGGQLFGPVPKGHRREFFCLDRHTWVWHEEWQEKGKRQMITTRYEVRPNGVLKIQDGQAYQRLSEPEARNLYWAIELYRQQVGAEYQRLLQTA